MPMMKMVINIPVEVVEAEIKRVYGLRGETEVEVLDVGFDEYSDDIVFLVRIDDEVDEEEEPVSDNWTVTTTLDFAEGIL